MGLFGSEARWQGWFGCPLTPYDADGNIDQETHAAQVRFLIDAGAPALCALMHMAESLNLSTTERKLLAVLTVEAAAGRRPVVTHVSCPGTDQTVALARHAVDAGAEGVVVVTPYHWRPGEDGLFAHFTAVGNAVDAALIAYSYPAAFGVEVTPGLALRLLEALPTFLGIKDAGATMPTFIELVRATSDARPDFSVFSGLEHLLPVAAIGGAGSFSACGVVAPRLVRSTWEAVSAGDWERARELQWRLSRVLELLLPRYPATIKAAADLMGRPLGPPRLPITPLSPPEVARLADALDACGVLEQEPFGWDASAPPDPEQARSRARVRT